MKIVTNWHPRPLVDWSELTETERKEFDYLRTKDERVSASFFRYKGQVYDLHEGEVRDDATGWPMWWCDTFFSATIARWPSSTAIDPLDYIIVGRAYA